MRTQDNEPPHETLGASLTEAADICTARQRVELVYDPQLLRDAGHQLADRLSEHLTKVRHPSAKSCRGMSRRFAGARKQAEDGRRVNRDGRGRMSGLALSPLPRSASVSWQ
jgi:hypothetical protein